MGNKKPPFGGPAVPLGTRLFHADRAEHLALFCREKRTAERRDERADRSVDDHVADRNPIGSEDIESGGVGHAVQNAHHADHDGVRGRLHEILFIELEETAEIHGYILPRTNPRLLCITGDIRRDRFQTFCKKLPVVLRHMRQQLLYSRGVFILHCSIECFLEARDPSLRFLE